MHSLENTENIDAREFKATGTQPVGLFRSPEIPPLSQQYIYCDTRYYIYILIAAYGFGIVSTLREILQFWFVTRCGGLGLNCVTSLVVDIPYVNDLCAFLGIWFLSEIRSGSHFRVHFSGMGIQNIPARAH